MNLWLDQTHTRKELLPLRAWLAAPETLREWRKRGRRVQNKESWDQSEPELRRASSLSNQPEPTLNHGNMKVAIKIWTLEDCRTWTDEKRRESIFLLLLDLLLNVFFFRVTIQLWQMNGWIYQRIDERRNGLMNEWIHKSMDAVFSWVGVCLRHG